MISKNKIERFLIQKNFTLVHLESVESTMIEIKKYFDNKNICMIADQQTAGIGRRGNKWISPKGNIYLSFMMRYDLKIEDHFLYTAITANSIVKLLTNYVKQIINIKWPNDININKKKIAGIMTEIIQLKNSKYIIIGMGINISTAPIISEYNTCCLKDYVEDISYKEVLFNTITTYFDEYDMLLKNFKNDIFNKFRSKLSNINSKVILMYPNGDIEKVFIKDVNFDGSLLVEKNGREERIFSARILK